MSTVVKPCQLLKVHRGIRICGIYYEYRLDADSGGSGPHWKMQETLEVGNYEDFVDVNPFMYKTPKADTFMFSTIDGLIWVVSDEPKTPDCFHCLGERVSLGTGVTISAKD